MKLERGTLVVVDLDPTRGHLDPTRGHEQRGRRPAIVVSDPEVSSDQRFPMICVVPLTSTAGTGALYPELNPGDSGLVVKSYALIDQLRAVSKARVLRVHGRVRRDELDSIDKGLYLFLGLEPPETALTY